MGQDFLKLFYLIVCVAIFQAFVFQCRPGVNMTSLPTEYSYSIDCVSKDTNDKFVISVKTAEKYGGSRIEVSSTLLADILERLYFNKHQSLITNLRNLKATPVSTSAASAAAPASLFAEIQNAASPSNYQSQESPSSATASSLKGQEFTIPVPKSYKPDSPYSVAQKFFNSLVEEIARPSIVEDEEQIFQEIANSVAQFHPAFPPYEFRLQQHTWKRFFAKNLQYDTNAALLDNMLRVNAFIEKLRQRLESITAQRVLIEKLDQIETHNSPYQPVCSCCTGELREYLLKIGDQTKLLIFFPKVDNINAQPPVLVLDPNIKRSYLNSLRVPVV